MFGVLETLRTERVSLHWGRKSLCRCEQVKDFEMRGLSWIIWVDPKFHHSMREMYPYKREVKGDLTQTEKEDRPFDHGGRLE